MNKTAFEPEDNMRCSRIFLALSLVLPMLAMAAETPPNLEPLPEVPPPPAGVDMDAPTEPQVTITKKGADSVEEYRINGELYMMKVTPPHGKSYYLMKEDQDGGWSRMEGPTQPLVIPKWVLFRF
ncbi:MAG: DUF2782 domain-containing protein [Candidatus Methylopumilus sp.]